MKSLPVVLACSLLTSTLAAQAAWTQLSPAVSPSARSGMLGVSDVNGVLLFGGKRNVGGLTDEMWRFDGTTWTDLTPATGSPTPRVDYSASYDIARRKYVLFGGFSTSIQGDTWEWDGTTWTQLSPATAPPARRNAAMVYDAAQGRHILFGGNSTAVADLGDTWAWDGTNWTQLSPTNAPPPRKRHNMAYDISDGTTLLFGGIDVPSGVRQDTWLWDGQDWQQIQTATIPFMGALMCGLTYDLLRDRFVLATAAIPGGFPQPSNTWEFDGADWIDRGVSSIQPRHSAAMTYVLAQSQTYLFGGYSTSAPTRFNETWAYQTANVASFSANSGGCAGTGSTPTLNAVVLPWVGDALTIEAGSTTAGATNFLLLALAPAAVPLAAIGFPACTLEVGSIAGNLPMIVDPTTGMPTATLMIPSTASLIGATLYVQAASLEPGFRLAMSGRGDVVLGAR